MNWLIAERDYHVSYSLGGEIVWHFNILDDAVMVYNQSPEQAVAHVETYLKEHLDIEYVSLVGFDANGRKVSARAYKLYDNDIREIPNE